MMFHCPVSIGRCRSQALAPASTTPQSRFRRATAPVSTSRRPTSDVKAPQASGSSDTTSSTPPGWGPLAGLQQSLQSALKPLLPGAGRPSAAAPAAAASAAAPEAQPETAEAAAAETGVAVEPAAVEAVEPAAVEAAVEEKSDEYTADMQKKMGTTLTYRHEDGINYNFILPDLIVGSCLQTPEDVDRLAEEAGVTTVFCLQEDCDLDYFKIDIAAIAARCRERGDIRHVRFPVRDFDPFDLRVRLPKAVARLAQTHTPRGGVAYIHCTAGMGRAPATALAYMYWLRGWNLQEAYEKLTGTRRCSPRVESIRAATADLLSGSSALPTTVALPRRGTVKVAQVAGLDFGWHAPMDLKENPKTKRLEITRDLLPGSYPFKFVLDGKWAASADYPMYKDGDNANNMLEVLPRKGGDLAQRERLLSPTGRLTVDERRDLAAMLCPWDSHDEVFHLPAEP